MKWFKHEDTSNNPKLEMLIDRHGLLGYGFYFKHLELIASNIKEGNKEEWGYIPSEYTTEFLSRKFGISVEDYTTLLKSCLEFNLFQLINEKIYCESILDRGDDYLGRMVKNKAKKTPKKKRSNSVVATFNVGTIEEEKEEEKEREEDISITNVMVKTQFGNQDVNEILTYFKEQFHLEVLDLSEKRNRYAASNLLRKYKGVQTVKALIDMAAIDDFWGKNITSTEGLLNNAMKIYQRAKGDRDKVAVQT